jgi:hypothetical protein
MANRKSFRSRRAVLLCTSLAVSSGATLGCNVYDDELLRRLDDRDGIVRDAAIARDDATPDTLSRDAGKRDDGEAAHDAVWSDTRAADDGAPPFDGALRDVVGDFPPADSGRTPDAPSVTPDAGSFDAPANDVVADTRTGADARVADAGTSGADAGDARDAPEDARADTHPTFDVTSDGDGGIAPPTFRVVRIGDGTAPLSGSSAPAFVEERWWDGTQVATAIALPVKAAGAQNALTLAGNATSEGALSLSSDERYLAIAGYATGPGRSSVAQTEDVDRVVARIDAAGNVDTTTRLGQAFAEANPRSAVSVDGTSFWVCGSTGGVWYFPFAGSQGTQITGSPDNVRLLGLFGDQLYGSSGAAPMTTVFTVGIGRPTSPLQTVAALAGLPRYGMSPYAFALFDRDAKVPGLDTLYLADDRSPESDGNGGGIQKWTLSGTTWSRVATFAAIGDGSASFRGLTGVNMNGRVTLAATTADPTDNRLVVFVDDGASPPVGKVIARAPANTIFRGVALSPRL